MDIDPSRPKYIASQGPLQTTLVDFWQVCACWHVPYPPDYISTPLILPILPHPPDSVHVADGLGPEGVRDSDADNTGRHGFGKYVGGSG